MKMAERKLLDGEVGQASMMDLRKSLGEIVLQVQMGKVFNITKQGKVIAVLSAPKPPPILLGAEVRRLGLAGD